MIPLHVLSNYSLLRGTSPIENLVNRAAEFGLPALALTDFNNMYGHISFYKHTTTKGVKPIFGVKISLGENETDYILILAKNNPGYGKVCKFITRKKLAGFSLDVILSEPHLNDLFLITPDRNTYNVLSGKFRESVYLEYVLKPQDKKLTVSNLLTLQEEKVKTVITAPVYFLDKNDYLLHKTVSAIREKTTLTNVQKSSLSSETSYFVDPGKIRKKYNEFSKYFDNTEYIASNCNVNLEIGKLKFPHFSQQQFPDNFAYLHQLCFSGLEKRYPKVSKKHIDRLNYELDVIFELQFTDYFLVVWDIVREAKQRGMLIVGRGSAANSLVSHVLGFTDVDPIKYDLYFERFLNRGRLSPPDIDIDFSWRERDAIIKYVYDKYGYDHVAMISTTITFRARSAFREVAKVFGFSNEQITPFAKSIPWTSARNLENLPELFPETKNLPFHEEPWLSIVRIASRLAGFPRHISIHPSGLVISPIPITDYVALEFAKNKGLGIVITQPDMYAIEELGLVKIDLLSQRSLGVLRDTILELEKISETQ